MRRASVAVRCALKLGLRDGATASSGVWAAHFRPHVKFLGRAQFSRLRFSALALAFCSSRVPSRLTVRSSRRRLLASLNLLAERAILAHNRRDRRGLTQSLGVKKRSVVLFVATLMIRLRGLLLFGWYFGMFFFGGRVVRAQAWLRDGAKVLGSVRVLWHSLR